MKRANERSIFLDRTLMIALVMAGILFNWATTGFAETKPISELGRDVVTFSTAWAAIPGTAYQVGREQGVLAGLALGPAKGTAQFAKQTAAELWRVVKPDDNPRPSLIDDAPSGLAFRYAF